MAQPDPQQGGVSMDRWQYLLVLAACLVITIPLEFLGTGVYRQLGRAARAILPVAANGTPPMPGFPGTSRSKISCSAGQW